MLTVLLKRRLKYLSLISLCCLIALGCSNKDEYKGLKAHIISPVQRYVEIKVGQNLYFYGEASGGVPPYEYNWDFCELVPSSSERSPGEIVFNSEGAYEVLFTVKDTKNNISTDSVKVIVGD